MLAITNHVSSSTLEPCVICTCNIILTITNLFESQLKSYNVFIPQPRTKIRKFAANSPATLFRSPRKSQRSVLHVNWYHSKMYFVRHFFLFYNVSYVCPTNTPLAENNFAARLHRSYKIAHVLDCSSIKLCVYLNGLRLMVKQTVFEHLMIISKLGLDIQIAILLVKQL